MTIYMQDGRVFRLIKPSAYGDKPTLSYEDGKLNFLTKEEGLVTINMDDIERVG